MQQTQDNEPMKASDATFELKRRLIARVDEASAAGQIGRLLRDTQNLIDIERDCVLAAVTDGWFNLYGWRATAALLAQFRPRNSIWLEIIVGDDHDRIGCLCIGEGAGALEFYGAWCQPGPDVIAKRIVVTRAETTWKPAMNWIALAHGTWSPSETWLRRADSWMAEHFYGQTLEPGTVDDAGADFHPMMLASLLVVVSQSPLLASAPLAEAA